MKHFKKILLIALMVTLAFSTSTFAAKKRKLIKTMKEYENGKLIYTQKRTYNEKGGLTKLTQTSNGNTETTKYKLTYWSKKSKVLKKEVISTGSFKGVFTYNRKGLIQKEVHTNGSDKTITTYKSKGNHLVSYVQKDSSGKTTATGKFDKHGNLCSIIDYNNNKAESKYKNTYKNGVLVKQVQTYPDGSTFTYTCNKHGDWTSATSKDSSGKITYKDTYKNTYKSGYLTKSVRTSTDADGNTTKTKTLYTYTKKKY